MKRLLFVSILSLAGASVAVAQITTSSTDVLGAHLNYGRGCTACHAPHSGVSGNGNGSALESASGSPALWGESGAGLYGKTISTGGGKYVEVLPTSMSATTPDVLGILACLTCHDGNYASQAMMKNRVYETLPSTYGSANDVPTLIGLAGPAAGNYLSQHPVGLAAIVNCGGPTNWDCTIGANAEIRMNGAYSSRFVSNYGFFIKPGNYGNHAVILCTTCHEPHRMDVVPITSSSASGLPSGSYATMFFLRAPYNPRDTNPMSNQAAQFCRQCHADKSNEMNGSVARTVF